MRVIVPFWHAARGDAIASISSAVDARAVEILDRIEGRLFDIGTLHPPRSERDELEQQVED